MSSLFLMLFSFLNGLASPSFEMGKVIGTDDFISVNQKATNIPTEYQNYVDAIGWANYGCTVTHIGQGLALTAGHCFEANQNIIRNKGCRFAEIRWGYRDQQNSNHRSKCENIISMLKTRTADFAILKVSNPPRASVPIGLNQWLAVGDSLTIFSHPSGRPLQWSQYCSLESPQGGEVPVENMSYTCDTEAGSSGALMISALTFQAVGIHRGGFPHTNYGTYLQEPSLKQELEQAIQEISF